VRKFVVQRLLSLKGKKVVAVVVAVVVVVNGEVHIL
jgi:hypothetical protein